MNIEAYLDKQAEVWYDGPSRRVRRMENKVGYFIAFGPCIACSKPFGFNPNLVPSVRINNVRQPICKDCVDQANVLRAANHVELIQVLPGAYAPAPEGENGVYEGDNHNEDWA